MEGLLGSLAMVEHFTLPDQSESLWLQAPNFQGVTEDPWLVQSMLGLQTAKVRASQFMEVADEEVRVDTTTRTVKELHLDDAPHGEGEEAAEIITKPHFNAQQEAENEGLIFRDERHKIFQDDSDGAASLVVLISDCTRQKNLLKGNKIHAHIIRKGLFEKNGFIGNAIVNMYAKCGALGKAQELFDILPCRNVVSWNALIAGYAQQERGEEALDCFERMQHEGFSPNAITFVCMLKACSSLGAIDKGQELHLQILGKHLLETNTIVGNALVDMYAKCGELQKAQKVFDELPVRDVIAWNALITGYAQHGQGEEALSCFERMQLAGLSPNPVTFVCILKACGSLGALAKGQELHAHVAKTDLLERNTVVASVLVDMYAKCGELEKAQEVFDKLPSRNVVVWNALIGGYAQHGHGVEALICFEQMQLGDVSPNSVTFTCILKACGSVGALDKGQEIHAQLAKVGLAKDDIHVGTALLDMYSKLGELERAQEVFDEILAPNVVSWNALLTGYAQQGHGEQALECFDCMQLHGFSPDATTFSSTLKASGSIGAAYRGQEIHAQIVRHGLLEKDIVVGTALVDMYANCGMLAEAQAVFDKLLVCDVVPWSALMEGYCQLGKDEVVFNLFDRMSREGTAPNFVTFTIVLNTCSHRGLLDKGQMFFEVLHKGYGIIPTLDHYCCMVDLFGRAGHVDKALTLIQEMPFSPNLTLWHTMLSACRNLGNMKLGRWAFEHAAQLGESDAAAFVCMNSILHG